MEFPSGRAEMPSLQVMTYDQVEVALDRFRGRPPLAAARINRQLREVLECIHQDPFEPELNVQEIRERCRIRDHNISSRFRHSLGTTIKDYIDDIRMRAACHLLATQPIGIFDVALYVGYAHPQTFYRIFRRRVGCTPAAYRRRKGEMVEGATA